MKMVHYLFSKGAASSRNSKLINIVERERARLLSLENLSKDIFLKRIRAEGRLCEIDFHGFFLEEALDILHIHIEYLLDYMEINKIKKQVKLTLVTGKGTHSTNKKPVLFPKFR